MLFLNKLSAWKKMSRTVPHSSVMLALICLAALSITACGKNGDLYLPEQKAQIKSSPDKQEQAKKDPKKALE